MASVANEAEFGANVTDKEERKKTRRKRIEKRNANDSAKSDTGAVDASAGMVKSGAERVAESLYHLDRVKHKGILETTSVRVRADETEAKRRIEDETLRHERLGKLQHEALSSGRRPIVCRLMFALK